MDGTGLPRATQFANHSDSTGTSQRPRAEHGSNNDPSTDTSTSLQPSGLPQNLRNLEHEQPSETSPVYHRLGSPPQRRTASTGQVPAIAAGESSTTFESPLRSIFVSGPPTASVSVNTALASLSSVPPSSSSGPFAGLANASGSRRSNTRQGESSSSATNTFQQANRPPILSLEKDVDDPSGNSMAGINENSSHNNSASLARLFVTSEGSTPGTISRGVSHQLTLSGIGQTLSDTSTLTGHLFHHGFIEGRHSDISVHAFGTSYKLHKLLLDRVPYFSSAFSGSWAESSAKEMILHPEDIDSNITRAAFELAIKRIYGTQFSLQEEQEAIGLLATACWLDMPELIDSCVESILRQMQPHALHELIRLVTTNYYGKAGDRILSSAKAMLWREGWEMPYECWDNIPAEVIREIVGGDPFFIPSEWDRWFLAVKILNRRLKSKAIDSGLVSKSGKCLHPKPTSLRFFTLRFDANYRRASSAVSNIADKDEAWISLYTSSAIAPLLSLLEDGIHYVHLRFEQLQQIRSHKDILGVPILAEKFISDALWMSMELRQRILNAHEHDLELGLTEVAHEHDQNQDLEVNGGDETSPLSMSRHRDRESEGKSIEEPVRSSTWDANGNSRKFWVPSNDVSCVMGGTREANIQGSLAISQEWNTQSIRLSSSNIDAMDVTWAPDFVLDSGKRPPPHQRVLTMPRYSRFPPFRFSAEFPTPRSLKEKKRVYSQTVWYAGSMWNLYIQRVNTSKSQQLGIYLHRAKDNVPSDDPLAQVVPATVDDRIGQLEREMLLRKTERRNQEWRAETARSHGDIEDDSHRVEGRYSGRSGMSSFEDHSTMGISSTTHKDEGSDRSQHIVKSPDHVRTSTRSPASITSRLQDSDEEDEELLRSNCRYNVPAMPPYTDSRPVIKTYFKIYSPDKAGRLLSIYESAPEKFVVSKSWGWKSSQMVFDEGQNSYDMTRGIKDGKLRYMVVLGNV